MLKVLLTFNDGAFFSQPAQKTTNVQQRKNIVVKGDDDDDDAD